MCNAARAAARPERSVGPEAGDTAALERLQRNWIAIGNPRELARRSNNVSHFAMISAKTKVS
jgi:hypothetical protein